MGGKRKSFRRSCIQECSVARDGIRAVVWLMDVGIEVVSTGVCYIHEGTTRQERVLTRVGSAVKAR